MHMKRISIVVGCLVVLIAAGGTAVAAQGETPTPGKTVLFHWAEGENPEWWLGARFAALGLVGALVTMFSLIGGAVPGTAGKAEIDADRKRLEIVTERLLALVESPAPDASVIAVVSSSADRLRDDLKREQWRQFTVASSFYLLLGGFFACALAYDQLQALIVGAGWTTYAGALGLKRDSEARKKIKDKALNNAEQVLATLGYDGHEPVAPTGGDDEPDPSGAGLMRDEIRVAKAV